MADSKEPIIVVAGIKVRIIGLALHCDGCQALLSFPVCHPSEMPPLNDEQQRWVDEHKKHGELGLKVDSEMV